MTPEDTSGVSPSPPSPTTIDTITKMIQNNKRNVIIGASSVLVLLIIIIITTVTTATKITTTPTTTTTFDAGALTQQVSLVLIRGGQLLLDT